MTTIHDAYLNALLADATYVNNLAQGDTGDTLAGKLEPRLTLPLANYVGSQFSVLQQIRTPSSFDATVWQERTSGKIYVSMRGTQEFIPDTLVADYELATIGLAYDQLADMVNWWLRETNSGSARQIAVRVMATIPTPNGIPIRVREFVAAPEVPGTGRLDIGAIASVNGHSLGGYLATAFTRLFGRGFPVAAINTFNSAGFSRPATPNIESEFGKIAAAIGSSLGLGSFDPLEAKQNNYFASNGINVTTNTWNPVGFRQIGTRTGLFQENLTPGVIDNHFMYKLTDLLALGDAMEQLDPSMTFEKLNAIVKAAANRMEASYETVLDVVRRLLAGADVTPTPIGDEAGGSEGPQPESRTTYQANLAAFLTSSGFQTWKGQLFFEDLSTASAGDLKTRAQGEIATRYALYQLNTFAVLPATPQLYSVFNQDGQLSIYDELTDKGLTDKWLEDRALFLRTKLDVTINDQYEKAQRSNYFEDKVTKYALGIPNTGPAYIFGSDVVDTLAGTAFQDHIYGGMGADTINAEGDNDYIEGGEGFDTIDGGTGDDDVYGGDGNDTISGDRGKDKLYGGNADDTINGGNDDDVIYGDRKDEPDSVFITGNDTISGGSGKDQIWGGGGKDTIHGDDDVDTIEGNAGDDTLYGDKGNDNVKGGKDVDTIYGGEGFDTIDGEDDGDTIYGGDSAADDKKFGNNIKGGAGEDFLYGDGGVDTIDGGEDKDLIVGNFGADQLTGGDGNDEIYGDIKDKDAPLGDKDRLDGGAGNDELYGGGGKDILFGAEDDDILRGGAFAGDFMLGGEGYDTYIYFSRDQIDFISDEDGEGEIQFDGVTLGVATSEHEGELVWYDTGNRCTATFRFIAYGDPDEGPVTLTIDNLHQTNDGLEIVDFQNGDLGINLEDGDLPDPNPSCPTPPPPPPQYPGAPNRGDPLVIDLGATGIATYGLSADMHLDMDGDGFAERVGFAGPQEGVLVLDRNGDGILSNGAELFGEFTPLGGGQLAVNGFQALSQFDRNKDGVIDALDPVWGSLRVGVWETDPFGNVIVADPGAAMSFRTMEELGIQSIGVGSTIVENQGPDGSGNTKTRTGSLTFAGGGTTEVAQYTFARDTSDTRAIDFTPVPPSIDQGPHLKLAGGPLATLKQALSRDATGGYLGKPAGALQAKLDAFLNETNVVNRYARFEDLLFAWTGADAIPAGTKTNDLDARHARVLEKAYGRSFQNPNGDQASVWQTTYESLAESMYGSLMSQTHFKSYYDAIDWERNAVTGKQFGDLAAVQASLDALLAADPVNGRATVNEFGRTLRGVQLTRNTDYMVFRDHFTGGGANPDLSFAFDAVGKPQQTLNGSQHLGYKFFSNFTEAVHSYPAAFLYVNAGLNVIYADNTTFGTGTYFGG